MCAPVHEWCASENQRCASENERRAPEDAWSALVKELCAPPSRRVQPRSGCAEGTSPRTGAGHVGTGCTSRFPSREGSIGDSGREGRSRTLIRRRSSVEH